MWSNIVYADQIHWIFLLLEHGLVYTVYRPFYSVQYLQVLTSTHIWPRSTHSHYDYWHVLEILRGCSLQVLGSSSHWPGPVVHYEHEDFECSRLLFWPSGKMLAVQQSAGSTLLLNEQNSDSTITHSVAKWWSVGALVSGGLHGSAVIRSKQLMS